MKEPEPGLYIIRRRGSRLADLVERIDYGDTKTWAELDDGSCVPSDPDTWTFLAGPFDPQDILALIEAYRALRTIPIAHNAAITKNVEDLRPVVLAFYDVWNRLIYPLLKRFDT